MPYPSGAEGEASVVLELLVEKDGSVGAVRVLEGAPPFAEQARRAVLTWRFTPARRGDAAVAAWIRARVGFRQGDRAAPAAPPAATNATTSAESAPPRAAIGEAEVGAEAEVDGARRAPGDR